MDKLVEFLAEGSHPVCVILKPEKTLDELIQCFKRKFINLEFTDTKGGTEIGINIGPNSTNENEINHLTKEVYIEGELYMNFVKVKVESNIKVCDFSGFGSLKII